MKPSNFAVVSRLTSSEKETTEDLEETLEFEFFLLGGGRFRLLSDILLGQLGTYITSYTKCCSSDLKDLETSATWNLVRRPLVSSAAAREPRPRDVGPRWPEDGHGKDVGRTWNASLFPTLHAIYPSIYFTRSLSGSALEDSANPVFLKFPGSPAWTPHPVLWRLVPEPSVCSKNHGNFHLQNGGKSSVASLRKGCRPTVIQVSFKHNTHFRFTPGFRAYLKGLPKAFSLTAGDWANPGNPPLLHPSLVSIIDLRQVRYNTNSLHRLQR